MILAVSIVFTVFIVLGTGLILFTKNIIHAAYGLGLVLILQAGIFVLLNAELLAVTQILLYAGGVVIILVFGVMMTNRKDGLPTSEHRNFIIPGIVSLLILIGLVWVISGIHPPEMVEVNKNQITEIGISFLTDHLVAFELIAFILLVALVGAAYLAKVSSEDDELIQQDAKS